MCVCVCVRTCVCNYIILCCFELHANVPPDTGLSEDTVQLWLLRILPTNVADLSLGIIGDEARHVDWD